MHAAVGLSALSLVAAACGGSSSGGGGGKPKAAANVFNAAVRCAVRICISASTLLSGVLAIVTQRSNENAVELHDHLEPSGPSAPA